jgi:CheY-like chemotaxis protein
MLSLICLISVSFPHDVESSNHKGDIPDHVKNETKDSSQLSGKRSPNFSHTKTEKTGSPTSQPAHSKGKVRSISEPPRPDSPPLRSSPNRKMSAPEKSKLSILIVDDDPLIRRVIVHWLKKYITNDLGLELSNFEILEAEEAITALQILYDKAPFLTFLDYEIKGELSGFHVITQVRDGKKPDIWLNKKRSTIVAISSSKELNAELNADYTCQKPIMLNPLKGELRQHFIDAYTNL